MGPAYCALACFCRLLARPLRPPARSGAAPTPRHLAAVRRYVGSTELLRRAKGDWACRTNEDRRNLVCLA
jgi:hypothetical protein